MMSYTDQTLP